VLEIKGLTKRYSSIAVVNGVSFVLKPGEVTGYLGPNGSGKSTTAKMLTGLVQPTVGQILLNGSDIQEDLIEYKRRLGYVPEEPDLYPYLSGREYLQLIGRLRLLSEKTLDRKIDGFLELFSLHRHRDAPISSYSKGMRQKILISGALLHNPDIVVFDEPESGLDVTSALILRNLVRSLAQDGKIVLYSSHILEVVEKVCSRVIILHKGAVVANDSVERLRDLMKLPSLEDIFSQLVFQENPEKIATEIVEVMKS
jgi:ABC-2 type transport system ATP-binding protein